MQRRLSLITAVAWILTQALFADEHNPSNTELGRYWQQRAKAAISIMKEEILNERELAGRRLMTQMVKTGEIDSAIALTDSMRESRIANLLSMGHQLVGLEKYDDARKVAALIETAIEKKALTIEVDASGSMVAADLRSLVGIYAGVSDFRKAHQTVSRITPEMDRISLYVLSKGYVELPTGRLRAESLWELAAHEVREGEVMAAKQTIREIKLRPMREAAYWSAAKRLAKKGLIDEALAFVSEIPPCDLTSKIYLIASEEGPEERDVASFRTDALITIALEQAESKDLKGANATRNLIPEEFHPRLIQSIAATLVAQDAYAEALEIARWQDDDEVTQWVVAEVARRQAENGDLDAAFATAKKVSSRTQQAFALLGIADRQIRNKDFMAAQQSAEEALAAIENSPVPVKQEVLLSCSWLLVGCGDRAGALKCVAEYVVLSKAVTDANQQQKCWFTAATYYGLADDLEQAEFSIAKLKLPGIAAKAWVEVSKHQAARGQREAALESLQKALKKAKTIREVIAIDAPSSKPRNLREIGRTMIALEINAELEAIIASESDNLVKAYLCLGAAESF